MRHVASFLKGKRLKLSPTGTLLTAPDAQNDHFLNIFGPENPRAKGIFSSSQETLEFPKNSRKNFPKIFENFRKFLFPWEFQNFKNLWFLKFLNCRTWSFFAQFSFGKLGETQERLPKPSKNGKFSVLGKFSIFRKGKEIFPSEKFPTMWGHFGQKWSKFIKILPILAKKWPVRVILAKNDHILGSFLAFNILSVHNRTKDSINLNLKKWTPDLLYALSGLLFPQMASAHTKNVHWR